MRILFIIVLNVLCCFALGCSLSQTQSTPSSSVSLRSYASTDQGVTFSAVRSVNISNTSIVGAVDPCAILSSNGKIRVYYFGSYSSSGDPVTNQPGGINRFYSAISVGTSFSQESQVLSGGDIGNLTISDPFVVKNATNTYVMYVSYGNNVLSARSTDEISFTWDDGYRTSQGGVPGALLLSSGKIRLFYHYSNGIKSAVSTDEAGLYFTTEEGYRIDPPTSSSSFDLVGDPNPIKVGTNNYIMCYKKKLRGQSSPAGDRVFIARSTDEGFTWTDISSEAVTDGSVPTMVFDQDGTLMLYTP